MIEKDLVRIVIPLYQSTLSELEMKMMAHNVKVLSSYHFSFVIPRGLDIQNILSRLELGTYSIVEVSNQWLGRENGIRGYNRMMLSKEFYQLFSSCEYILICQSDAIVFRDELLSWCEKGYDYIGAPWIKAPFYSTSVGRSYLMIKKWFSHLQGMEFPRQILYDRVGNGGFSLRKVGAMIKACDDYSSEIQHYLFQKKSLYNEDVFFSVVPLWLKKPSCVDALRFSFDTRPNECLKQNKGELPFGAHAVSKKRYIKFWSKTLEDIGLFQNILS